ncbi:hypothetical protein ACP_0117 [Acidobacterium capsulatum ATCC 51196]|uniref:Uncharacterized protein n=1 Tax=Acidobacterium capsulatum (strain ATCC 51196 / DSM 11244 / BCRC 80197 / JCM 7670 / NBRC 15755 / NCIMB 13165 / 161) TaxID=240015 RepID=C1F8J1_ACIC5|nr:hypothetical protein ACP_0117 [Acidobacterium capsulatum ATCC 51196]
MFSILSVISRIRCAPVFAVFYLMMPQKAISVRVGFIFR